MKFRRVLGLLLVVCLAIGVMALSVSAESVTASGECGDRTTWKLEDGKLTISGYGIMKDYSGSNRPAWHDYSEEITEVVIEQGVTAIGDQAFYGLPNLARVSIPNSVKTIGECAFVSCSSLADIVIPDSVTTIEATAFSNCTGLKNITLSKNLESIRDYCFYGCADLQSIEIPESVTFIGSSAFSNCSTLTKVEMPDSVVALGASVFMDCTALREVTVSAGASYFDIYVFNGCRDLTVRFTGSVEYMSKQVFDDAENVTAYYPANDPSWTDVINQKYDCKVNWIPVEPLGGECGENLTWTLDKGTLTISGTGPMTDYAGMETYVPFPWMKYAMDIHTVVIEPGATSITKNAFSGFRNVTSVSIPDSVTSIGTNAFNYCQSLENIDLPDNLTSIGESAFAYCKKLTSVVIPDQVSVIRNNAFSLCAALKSVTLPQKLTSIEKSAFYSCKAIESIEIPAGVTSIGESAFSDCSGLSVHFAGSAPTIDASAFYNARDVIAYYPAGDSTWNDETKQNYGGRIAWVQRRCEHKWMDALCDRPMTCSICGEIDGEPLGHKVSDGVCKACGEVFITITKQPKTTYTALGEKAKFTVKAEGEGLTYQWYYKDVDGSKYKKCSGTKATYSLEMTEARKDRKLYCIITDAYGNEVKSKTVTMKMAASIKTQPKTQYVQLDEKAKFTVKAVGEDLKYQWYYKSAGSSKYKKASCTKATYTITMTEDRKDRKFYCVVTDKKGNEVKSKTVTMKMAASIKTEPKSVKTSIGKKAKFTVKAVGDDLKYQWYYKDTDGKKYKKASCTKATYSIELTKARNGRKFYCVVTDKYGNEVKTKTVSMKKK